MAEDDEIDILGDFSMDNLFTKNDSDLSLVSQNSNLLDCQYTIHPQWLLDKPSANPDCWYSNDSVSTDGDKAVDFGGDDGYNMGPLLNTEDAITDESGWTEREKNLLERGIEIFGKSNMRLSQFIGSRTPSEVRYYLKNFYMETQPTYTGFNSGDVDDVDGGNNLVSDILHATQIPASIEEVIAAVSSAKPTIPTKHKKINFDSNSDDEEIICKNNSLKPTKYTSNGFDHRKVTKYKKKDVKFKFKTQLKLSNSPPKRKIIKKFIQKHEVQITTGEGLGVPVCKGEEIVKLKKLESDSEDEEVDIDDSGGLTVEEPINIIKPTIVVSEDKKLEDTITKNTITIDKIKENKVQKSYLDLSTVSDEIVKKLTDLEEPKAEIMINQNVVSDLEKCIHSEFFENRPTKTPLRYLKIRNHILNSWISNKPNYVTKTSVRQGLKNCGDVHCIGRVHCYLEQIGAINFGCRQTSYERPLYDVFQALVPTPREKTLKNDIVLTQKVGFGCRPRVKRKLGTDGEGGCTLTHDEKGDVINTTIVNEEGSKPKVYVKRPSVRLIYCKSFTPHHPQSYKVRMNLTTLLLMDFHAHTSLTEVMGLVAGFWNSIKNVLTISHYEPCQNIASSATHCDMCPISQARAAEIIHGQDLDILGWFHSHPTFAPEPSQQDLETQQHLQLWIGSNSPCLGVILSPFSLNGALIASPFRCMMVEKKENFEDQMVPYKFDVEIVASETHFKNFFAALKKTCNFSNGNKRNKTNFNKPYFQDSSLTFLDKYITSVRMHLAKCGTLNKMSCDYIVENIRNICS